VNSVTPDVISGKGDGICRDDEIAIACVDDGRVLANLRSNEQARIMLWQMPQQRSQMLRRKFADWQNLLWLAASHAHPVAISDGRPYCDSYSLVNGHIWSMEGVEERSRSCDSGLGPQAKKHHDPGVLVEQKTESMRQA
jgi:hypothetical protein